MSYKRVPQILIKHGFQNKAYDRQLSFVFKFSFSALFTVEAPKSLYTAELGSNVTMECVFPVNGKLKFRDLSVIWEKKDEVRKDVYILLKGKEDSGSQHSDFQGRIKLLKENLDFGQSLLQISNVKLRDAGLYHCLIEYGGADYKTINLKVQGESSAAGGSLYCGKILGQSWQESMSTLAFQESSPETATDS